MICIEISIPHEGSIKEYVSTLEQTRDYIKGLHPSQYDFSYDNIEVYVVSKSIDVYELMKDST